MAGRTIFAGGDIEWHENQIRIMLAGPEGETSQEIQRRARAVQKRAQRAAPYKTGHLRGSISVNTTYPSEGAAADITANAPYALAVEFGRRAIDLTGSKKYLSWQGEGGTIVRQKVRAVAATHFMQRALDETGDGD
jgi:hypothetical protein